MQQAGRGEEGDRFVSCGLRALPGGSAGAGPIHSPHPAPSCPHSSATHPGAAPGPAFHGHTPDPASSLGPQVPPQEGQKCHRAPRMLPGQLWRSPT